MAGIKVKYYYMTQFLSKIGWNKAWLRQNKIDKGNTGLFEKNHFQCKWWKENK